MIITGMIIRFEKMFGKIFFTNSIEFVFHFSNVYSIVINRLFRGLYVQVYMCNPCLPIESQYPAHSIDFARVEKSATF